MVHGVSGGGRPKAVNLSCQLHLLLPDIRSPPGSLLRVPSCLCSFFLCSPLRLEQSMYSPNTNLPPKATREPATYHPHLPLNSFSSTVGLLRCKGPISLLAQLSASCIMAKMPINSHVCHGLINQSHTNRGTKGPATSEGTRHPGDGFTAQ